MECDTGDCVSFTFSDLCLLILKSLVLPGAICGSLANSQHWGVGLPRVWTDIILRDGLCQEWLILAGDSGSSRRDTWGGPERAPVMSVIQHGLIPPVGTLEAHSGSGTSVRACMLSLQLSPTLCEPTDSSPPGPSARGILQARILEWVAMPSSRDLPDPRIEPASLVSNLHWQVSSLPLVPPGKT